MTPDESRCIVFIVEWCGRMAKKYGGTVCSRDGNRYDWGQALARECYGIDWNDVVPDIPTRDDVNCAVKWESGEIPSWVLITN